MLFELTLYLICFCSGCLALYKPTEILNTPPFQDTHSPCHTSVSLKNVVSSNNFDNFYDALKESLKEEKRLTEYTINELRKHIKDHQLLSIIKTRTGKNLTHCTKAELLAILT
ncbi:hypothetical protein C7H19_23785 [Aphanothece hegewaldii CCALA 016]|uniref:Uncharacterized protein n=1 Tax=Aphanothece hegewaldii CCALA 016 TaxID=2107694 RepID=A0A2T1LR24_9CHRO|nr:hypothetical protein [Aphanothece hegewaldii]PSF30536.1 hypothetical protein C7H19_23785 [Aphanothece hegewaldii CCALA 016]